MVKIYVTYPGDAWTRFDRNYYVHTHLPLVMVAWEKYGLQTLAAFFPTGDGAGTVVICQCCFRDQVAVDAAFSSSEAGGVMDDIIHFTDATPSQSRVLPL